MCGIVGLVGDWGAPLGLVGAMMTTIRHRGPDQNGVLADDEQRVFLGHQRLSIIDLSENGRQPMEGEDCSIVFNGEIYNFIELRKKLEGERHFVSHSDTEVLLHGYRAWGLDGLLKRVHGMFAFALHDRREGKLHLARDRMGEKPLYFSCAKEGFAFASEFKAMACLPLSREIDPRSLNMYFTFGYVPSPATMIKGIRKLEPGRVLSLDTRSGDYEIRPYWRIPAGDQEHTTERDALLRLDSLLSASVERCLVSDVPLGVFLSGGLDSSITCAIAARHHDDLRTFSVVYDDKSFDESTYSRLAAKALGTRHTELRITSSEARKLIQNLHDLVDEPMADMSLVPTHLLSCKAREHVTVVLGGDGADELFIGYPTHLAHRLSGIYKAFPSWIRWGINGGIGLLPTSYSDFSLDFRLKRFVASAVLEHHVRHFSWQAHIPFAQRREFCPEAEDPLAVLDGFLREKSAVLHKGVFRDVEYLDKLLYLPDDILSKVDIAAMKTSLEVRCPYLDHELVEFASRLPERFKFRMFHQKYILSRLGETMLPREIVRRKKKGFGMPIGRWLRGELHDYVRDTLSPSALAPFQVNHARVCQALDDHREGRVDNRKVIWSLLVLVNWMKVYAAL